MPESDRPTVPNEACEHKVANHHHGTLACHNLDLCRCDDCRAANRRYEHHRKSWTSEFPTAEPPLVDAEPVVEHCRRLMDQGMGLKRIAEVAGVTHSVLGNIVYGRGGSETRPANKIRRDTARKVLRLRLNLADGAPVPKAEATAIVEELEARGWSKARIAKRVTHSDAQSLQVGKGPTIQAGKLRTLRQLLLEPVPLRLHGPSGRMYDPSTDHVWRHIPESTPGVPSDWHPGSPVWLNEMRRGLKRAVEESIERHGRVAA